MRLAASRAGVDALPKPFALDAAAAGEGDAIARLVRPFAARGLMLPRTAAEVEGRIGAFRVIRAPDDGIVACGSLRPLSASLAEISTLAVAVRVQGRGLGLRLLDELVREGWQAGFGTLCALTVEPEFFARAGFREVPRATLPEKEAVDCARCPFAAVCRERAVVLDRRGPSGT